MDRVRGIWVRYSSNALQGGSYLEFHIKTERGDISKTSALRVPPNGDGYVEMHYQTTSLDDNGQPPPSSQPEGGVTMWPVVLLHPNGNIATARHEAADRVIWDPNSTLNASYGFTEGDLNFTYHGTLSTVTPDKPSKFPEGARWHDPGVRWHTSPGARFVVLDGKSRLIPDPDTYFNLFAEYDSCPVSGFDNPPTRGADITKGACLVRPVDGPRVYLLVDGLKRWIASPDVLNRFGFNQDRIVETSSAGINAIQSGDDIDGRAPGIFGPDNSGASD